MAIWVIPWHSISSRAAIPYAFTISSVRLQKILFKTAQIGSKARRQRQKARKQEQEEAKVKQEEPKVKASPAGPRKAARKFRALTAAEKQRIAKHLTTRII